jgi:hypothetical protein
MELTGELRRDWQTHRSDGLLVVAKEMAFTAFLAMAGPYPSEHIPMVDAIEVPWDYATIDSEEEFEKMWDEFKQRELAEANSAQ